MKNPILSERIFQSWDEKTRKEYLELLNFGYQLLENPIVFLKEYQQQTNTIDLDTLINKLSGTELANQLLDKISTLESVRVKNTLVKSMTCEKNEYSQKS